MFTPIPSFNIEQWRSGRLLHERLAKRRSSRQTQPPYMQRQTSTEQTSSHARKAKQCLQIYIEATLPFSRLASLDPHKSFCSHQACEIYSARESLRGLTSSICNTLTSPLIDLEVGLCQSLIYISGMKCKPRYLDIRNKRATAIMAGLHKRPFPTMRYVTNEMQDSHQVFLYRVSARKANRLNVNLETICT